MQVCPSYYVLLIICTCTFSTSSCSSGFTSASSVYRGHIYTSPTLKSGQRWSYFTPSLMKKIALVYERICGYIYAYISQSCSWRLIVYSCIVLIWTLIFALSAELQKRIWTESLHEVERTWTTVTWPHHSCMHSSCIFMLMGYKLASVVHGKGIPASSFLWA